MSTPRSPSGRARAAENRPGRPAKLMEAPRAPGILTGDRRGGSLAVLAGAAPRAGPAWHAARDR